MDAHEHVEEPKSEAIKSDAAEQVATNVVAGAAKDRRLERIMDYLAASLRKRDALQATLGAVNSDLMAPPPACW